MNRDFVRLAARELTFFITFRPKSSFGLGGLINERMADLSDMRGIVRNRQDSSRTFFGGNR